MQITCGTFSRFDTIFTRFDSVDAVIMHTNKEDKLTLTNSRLFKANLGNSSTYKALNCENKIQAHSRFSRPHTNPRHASVVPLDHRLIK